MRWIGVVIAVEHLNHAAPSGASNEESIIGDIAIDEEGMSPILLIDQLK